MSMTEIEARAEYIAGLRALADTLEATPKLPLPYASGGIGGPVTFEWSVLCSDDPVAEMAQLRSLIGAGRWEKNAPTDSHAQTYFVLTAHLRGVDLVINAFRNDVCQRVVTGTREVEVPEQPAVPAHVETVDDVEWVCAPLLAEASA